MGCIFAKPSPEGFIGEEKNYNNSNNNSNKNINRELNLYNYIKIKLFGSSKHQQICNNINNNNNNNIITSYHRHDVESIKENQDLHAIDIVTKNNSNNNHHHHNNSNSNSNLSHHSHYEFHNSNDYYHSNDEYYENDEDDNDEDDNEMPIPTIVTTPQPYININNNNNNNNSNYLYHEKPLSSYSTVHNKQITQTIGRGVFSGSNRPRSNTKETLRAHTKRHKDGHKMVNEYVFIRKLGKGTFGKVKLAYHHDTHHLYAVKIFNKIRLKKQTMGIGRPNAFDEVLKEIAIMKKMNHLNVVKLYEVINDPEEEYIYIVMEYIEGGSIMSIIEDNTSGPMSEDLARKYFRDIVHGIEYLHEQKVIHRDLKPENLLVDGNGVVKITDFGVSYIFENDDVVRCTRGSPAFLAPELCFSNDDSIPISGKSVDIWALGVSLYCLIFARVPFTSNSLLDVYDKIVNQEIIYPREISEELMDLFKKLLDKNPATRIQIAEIKSHKWTTINGTLEMKELDHLVLSVTDQEMIDAISTDHTVEPNTNTSGSSNDEAEDDDEVEDLTSSSDESSGIIGSNSSVDYSKMYSNSNNNNNNNNSGSNNNNHNNRASFAPLFDGGNNLPNNVYIKKENLCNSNGGSIIKESNNGANYNNSYFFQSLGENQISKEKSTHNFSFVTDFGFSH